MFGEHDFPLLVEQEDLSLVIEEDGPLFVYQRNCQGEKAKRILAADKGKLLINPVEPLNKPKDITPYLLIEFETPVMVAPRANKKVLLTFPVEIGAFISVDSDFEILDIFALIQQKFTLYGDPSYGAICKYWKSGVFPAPPSGDPLREGTLDLEIQNITASWIEVTRGVFSAYGMKIYYDEETVAMRGTLKIKGPSMAETEFQEFPPEAGMTRALDLYTAKKLSVSSTKFVMEFGL